MLGIWRSFIRALRALMMLPSLIQTALSTGQRPKRFRDDVSRMYNRKMDQFLRETKRLFESPLQVQKLLDMSEQLQEQFEQKLQASNMCMLPSFNHTLPSGHEQGTYLALDVGGSTFRVALVKLNGKGSGSEDMHIAHMRAFKIDGPVKKLKGVHFFDWMAQRIEDVLAEPGALAELGNQTLGMGLAWSFPIEQTSIRRGLLLEMGKGFAAGDGTVGQDLTDLITNACERRKLKVRVEVILNDSDATLLSRAYQDPDTRFAVILGTGMNASIHLPITAFSQAKFGLRPQSWHDKAKHVLVNTEVSMFGKNVFPLTKWDEYLKLTHPNPDFQPFEHLVSGGYIGEIVRLVLVDAIAKTSLFGGEVPANFTDTYSFDTGIMAAIEGDTTPNLSTSAAIFQKHHPLSKPPTLQDLQFVRQICCLVSHRAAAYLAAGIHALWSLRNTSEGIKPADAGHFAIGCNGSVIEKYPSYKAVCQEYLDDMIEQSGGERHSVVLEDAIEAAIFGAAVAACCAED